MNRVSNVVVLRVVATAIILCCGVNRLRAQTPATPPPEHESTKSPDDKDAKETKDAKEAKEDEEDKDDPFAPEPAPALPPGMTGSDANDPRAKLAPGLYDAGETSMGIKHLLLLKKPDAFQLGATDPDDPKVQKVIGQLGMRRAAKLPKPTQLVVAQLAFANSDLAFQRNHLFQGNFYGVNIYDISNPANATLLTSLVCPGGQGDVSVYKNLMFMSVEMPNGRLDCGVEGFPLRGPPPTPEEEKEKKRRPPAPQQRPLFRGGENLRYFRHQESQASCRGADLPRIAYAYLGGRSQRQRKCLYLCFGHLLCASAGRTGWMLR